MGERRRAIVVLNDEIIHRILELPDELQVIGVQADFVRMGVQIMVEGDGLDPVSAGCCPPDLPGEWVWDQTLSRPRWLMPGIGSGGE